MDFALRTFKQKGIEKGRIIIYGMMGLYSEAVKLALQMDNFYIAKDYAGKPDDPEQQKKLWLQIAIYMINAKKAVQEVIQLTKDSEIL